MGLSRSSSRLEDPAALWDAAELEDPGRSVIGAFIRSPAALRAQPDGIGGIALEIKVGSPPFTGI
jgi:hypothetical protein